MQKRCRKQRNFRSAFRCQSLHSLCQQITGNSPLQKECILFLAFSSEHCTACDPISIRPGGSKIPRQLMRKVPKHTTLEHADLSHLKSENEALPSFCQALLCQVFNCGRHFRRQSQTKRLKTKFKERDHRCTLSWSCAPKCRRKQNHSNIQNRAQNRSLIISLEALGISSQSAMKTAAGEERIVLSRAQSTGLACACICCSVDCLKMFTASQWEMFPDLVGCLRLVPHLNLGHRDAEIGDFLLRHRACGGSLLSRL